VAPPASYRISAYCDAAASLYVELVIGSDSEHSLVSAVADGIQLPLQNIPVAVAMVREAHRRSAFAAVLASDDATVELASAIAESLGLAHNPVESARISGRKDLARAAQARAGLPVPHFRRIDLFSPIAAQVAGVEYPCVLKPLALSGSRGVIRADDEQELIDSCARLRQILQANSPGAPASLAAPTPLDAPSSPEHRFALVEQYLGGVEIAVEAMLSSDGLEMLAIFDKPEPLVGPYFEESYYVTPSRLSPALQSLVQTRVEQLCTAYGLVRGPVHAEFRIDNDEVWPLELASRTIGGDCARLLQFGAGHSLEALVIARALGIPLTAERAAGAGGVLMIPIPRSGILRRVEGVLAAQKVPLVEDVYIAAREGHELLALPEGSSYLGFIFARGSDSESVERALRAAHACLSIVIAPMWRIEAAS